MIDTHAHLNFAAFDDDWEEVVQRAVLSGVTKMIVVGTDIKTSMRAVELARKSPVLYASVGIHPHHAKQYKDHNLVVKKTEILKHFDRLSASQVQDDMSEIEELTRDPKVVAIGEIGLDYHVYTNSKRYEDVEIDPELIDIQKEIFIHQLNLAKKYNKAVIVHSRKVKRQVFDILQASEIKEAVFHCFEGGKKFAREIINAGYYISFTGSLTYDLGKSEVSKEVPLERLLLETDCPYTMPMPEREKSLKEGVILRSEPRHVKIIGQYHAGLRGVSERKIEEITTKNACQLFGLLS